MHTVFAGDDTPEVPEPPTASNEGPAEPLNAKPSISDTQADTQGERTPLVAETEVAVHHATCDICDDTIKGDRFVSAIYKV